MQSREDRLVEIMSTGFERAARSFSGLVNRKVKVSKCMTTSFTMGTNTAFVEGSGRLYVLVTRLIGNIAGKSFLIFNQAESEEIFSMMNMQRSSKALNEAFLLEIDNIISASVIAELANALALEVYGDVPAMVRISASELDTFIGNEIGSDKESSVVFCNTTFQVDERDAIHPQFVWILSNKIFESITV